MSLHKELVTALHACLDEALDLPRAERAAWLDRVRIEFPVLAPELEALLEQEDDLDAGRFLEGDEWTALIDVGRSLAGRRVGAYTLERPIGRGGMGSVWLARRSDGRYEGRVAVKLLNLALLDPVGAERFRREGTALARLTHPNITRLIDAGVTDGGQPYLVLEYVEGHRVDLHCDEQRLPPEQRLRLFLDVLAAVGDAHAHLIVHRDLKPSNILVTGDGAVKLLDFGIAKLLETDAAPGQPSQLTELGGIALTPEYAAPEQALGAPVTTATDVYALGVLLYVLLAGQHPTGEGCRTAAEHISGILDTEPPRLSVAVGTSGRRDRDDLHRLAAARATTIERLERLYLGDIDNILAKALKKNPAERYATVAAFADDLRRYLNNEPVSARPDTMRYRMAKLVRRNRTAVALTAVAALAVLIGLVATITQAERATRQALLAEEQRDRADREAIAAGDQRDFALRQLSRAEAINNLNDFLLSDAAPSGQPFTVGALLGRAESIIEREHGESDENRVEMFVVIGRRYQIQDEDAKARPLLGRAYELSRRLTDRSMRAKAGCALASAVARAGQGDRAEELIREGLAELPSDPRFTLDRIFCLLRGSEVARNGSDSRAGVDRAVAAQRLLEEVRFPSAVLEMRVLMDVAEAYRTAGRYPSAIHVFEQAYRRLQSLGRENTETAGTLFNNWALSLDLMGRPLEAEVLFRRAIQVSSAEHGENSVSPMLLNNFARVLAELHQVPQAASYAERAYSKAQRAGDEVVIYQALIVRASVYRMLGDVGRSARMLAEVEPRLTRMLPPGHPAFAALASQHALVAEARGDFPAASAWADRAVAIVEASHQDRSRLSVMLLRRAGLELETRRFIEARADAVRSIELSGATTRSAGPASGVGLAYLALGRANRALGELDEARSAFASALQHLRPTLGAGHPDTRMAERLAREAPASASR